MSDTTLASIIIVNYNYARFVGAVIDSALAQPWPRDAVIERGPDVFFSPPCSGNAWAGRFVRRVMPMPEDGLFRRHAEMYLVTLSPIFGTIRRLPTPQSCYRLHGGNDWASKSQRER